MIMLNKLRVTAMSALWLWGLLFLFLLNGKAYAVKLYVEGSSVAPSQVVSSQKNAPLLKLRVYTDTSTATFNSLKIKREGEIDPLSCSVPPCDAQNVTDIQTATLYKDANNNGIYDTVDVLMATSSYDGTHYTFTSATPGSQLPRTIDTFGETYLVTYNMSPSATTNRTITAVLVSELDVGASVALSTLDYLGTRLYPVVSFASDTQTNIAATANAGQANITVTAGGASGLVGGDFIVIGTGPTKEVKQVQSVAGNVITIYTDLLYPYRSLLTFTHGSPEELHKLKPTTIGNKLFVFGSDYATRAHPTEYRTFVVKPSAGTTEVFVDQLRFCNPSTSAVTVSSIKLARVGSASDSDILNVKLYDDLNDNLATSGAAFLNSGAFSNGFVTITIPGGYVIPAGSCNIGASPGYKAPAFKNLVVKFEIPSTASTDVKAGIGIFDTTYISAGSNTVVAFAAFMNPEDENDDCDLASATGSDPYEPGDTRVLVDTILDNLNGILPYAANTTATLWEGFDCGANQQKSVRWVMSCYNTSPSRGRLNLQGSNITCYDPLLPAENPPSWVVSWPNLYIRTDPFSSNAGRIEIGSILEVSPPEYAVAFANFSVTDVEQGKLNVPVLGAKLKSQAGAITVNSISMDSDWVGGPTATASDISLVKVIDDLNKNGIFDAGEPLLATDNNAGSISLDFRWLNPSGLVVNSGTDRYLLFVYDFHIGATTTRTYGARITSVNLGSLDAYSIVGGPATSNTTNTIIGNSVNVTGFGSAPSSVKTGTNSVGFLRLTTSVNAGMAVVDAIRFDLWGGGDISKIGVYDDANGDGFTTSTELLEEVTGPFGAFVNVDFTDAPVVPESKRTVTGPVQTALAFHALSGQPTITVLNATGFLPGDIVTIGGIGGFYVSTVVGNTISFALPATGNPQNLPGPAISCWFEGPADYFKCAGTEVIKTQRVRNFLIVADVNGAAGNTLQARVLNAGVTLNGGDPACLTGDCVAPFGSVFSRETGVTLTAGAGAGTNTLTVTNSGVFAIGDFISIGEAAGTFEVKQIAGIAGNVITLGAALANNHVTGEKVSGTTLITNYDTLLVTGQGNTPSHFVPSSTFISDTQTNLASPTIIGQTTVSVLSVAGLAVNDQVTIGTNTGVNPASCGAAPAYDGPNVLEGKTITAIDALAVPWPTVTFSSGLKCNHNANEIVFKAGEYVYEHQMLILKLKTISGEVDFKRLRVKAISKDFNGTPNSNFPANVDTSKISVRLDRNLDSLYTHDGVDCVDGFLPENCNSPTSTADQNREDLNLAVPSAYDPVTGYIQFSTTGSDPTLFRVQPDVPNGLKEVWLTVIFPVKSSAVSGNRIAAEVKFSNPDFGNTSDIEIETFSGDTIQNYGTLSSGEMIIGGNNLSMFGSSLTTGTQTVQQGEKFGVLKLTFSASGPETSRAVELSKLQIKRTGSATDSDVNMLSLFEDTNANGAFDGADLLMSTVAAFDTANPGYATFSSWTRTISVVPGGATQQALLVYTLSNNAASGVTLGAEITNASFLKVNSPDTAVVTSPPVTSSNVTTKGNTVVVTGASLAPAKITPATIMGTTTMAATSGVGATTVSVGDTTGVTTGDYVRVGSGATQEELMISNVTGNVVSVYTPFANAHNGTGCTPSPACIETVVKLKSTTLVMEKLSFSMMSTFNYDSSPSLLPTAEVTTLQVKALNSGNLNFMRIYRDNGSGTLDSADRLLSSTGTFVGDVATFSSFNALLESTLDGYSQTTSTTGIIISDIYDEGRRFIAGDFVVIFDPQTVNEEKFTISSVAKYSNDPNCSPSPPQDPKKCRTVITLSSPLVKAHTLGTAKVRTYIQPGQSKDFLVVFNMKITATGTTRAEIPDRTFITVSAPDGCPSCDPPPPPPPPPYNPALSPTPLQSVLSTIRDLITVTPTSLAPTNVSLGQTNVPMLKMYALADTNVAILEKIKIYESGSSPTDNHVSLVKIYKDTNSDGLFDSADVSAGTIGAGTFTSQNATLTLSPAQAVSTASSLVLFAAYDISNVYLATSYTLGARVSDETFMTFTAPDEAAATNFPLTSDNSNVLANDTLTVLTTDPDTESVAPLYAKRNTNVALEKITLSASSASITVNSLKVNKLGNIDNSYNNVDLKVKLYADNTSTVLPSIPGTYDSTDTLILSTTFDATTKIASFDTPFAVSYTQNKVLFVGVDIPAGAPDNDSVSIGVKVNNGDVSVASPDNVASHASFQSDLTTISIKDSITVSKSSFLTAPTQITRGTSDEMLKLTMTAGSDSVTVTSIKIFESGSATAATDVEFASLYEDLNGNNDGDAGELLSTSTFSSEMATFNLSPPGLVVSFGTPRSFIISYKISATAVAQKTVQAQLVNSTYVTVASPDVVSFSVSPLTSSSSTIIGNKLTVTKTGAVTAPANIEREGNALMMQLNLSASAGTITVSSIKINGSGNGNEDNDVEKTELILDADGDGVQDPGESVLATATFSSQYATFSNLNLAVTSGADKKLLIKYYISSNATVLADAVAVSLTNNTFVTVVSPDQVETTNFPINSAVGPAISDITGGTPDTLTVSGLSLSPAQVYQGQTGVAIERLTLTALSKSVYVTGITLTENGTSTVDTDVSSVKIYKDNGDGSFNAATDTTVLGSGTFSSQSATMTINDGGTGSLRVDNASGSKDIFVVYDISASATLGQTVGMNVASGAITVLTLPVADTVAPFPPGIASSNSTIIAPPDTLTITGTDLTASYAGTVEQSQQDVGMLKLTLTAGTGSVTLTSLKIDESGTSALDTDISSVKLYQDTGNGTLEVAADTLLSSGTLSSQSITFTPLSVAVSAGTPKDLFVVYSISATATTGVNINASVTAAGNVSVAFPDAVSATFPVKSNEVTIGGNTVTVTGTSVAPATVAIGQSGVSMEKLTFSVASGAATVTQIKVDESGSSASDSDISAVKLYLDEGNGNFDGTEALQLSTTFTSQTANIGAISIPVSVGAPGTVFIVYDISASSTNGVDFKAKVVDATYITVAAPDTVGSFTAIESSAASLPDTIAPAAIASLSASGGVAHGEVVLTWTAPGDDGSLAGTKATKYTIKRAGAPISDETAWAAATTITNAITPALQGAAETFTVSGLTECTTYYFAVKAEDEVPNVASLSNTPGAQPRDGQAPVITHTPQTAASANNGATTGISLTATIADGCSVSSATLYYRKTGDTTYVNTPLSLSSGTYSATIPQALITDNTAGIDYYLEAKDPGNNTSTYPASPPRKIGTFKAFAFAAPWSLKSIVISAADYGPIFSSPVALVTQTSETSVTLAANDSSDTTPPVGYTGKYTLVCAPPSTTTLAWKIRNQSTPAETFDYPSFTAQCLNPSLAPQAIASQDGKLRMDVPESAVKEEVVVTVIPVDDIKESSTPAKQLAKMSSYIPRQPEKLLFVGGSYQVGPYRYALEKQAQLTLLYEDSQLESLPESKLGLYSWNDEKLQWEYIGGTIQSEENKVTASTANFSTYRIILDNVPPDVKNFKPGDKDRYLTRTPEISADLSDLGSGVDPSSVTMYIDGSAVAVQVDAEKGRFTYKPEAPLAAGEHEIMVVVRDKVGNEARLEKQKLLIPGDIKIERVFNAPNPVRSWGEIAFQYEVDEVNAKFFDIGGYTVTIEVYTLSGKRIAFIEGNGLATKQKIGKYIRFRRKVDEGIELPHLSNGVYIFRLVARDFEGKTISKINKLVVAR